MTVTYHHDIQQGSEEWIALRCGLLTASEMKLILTPTLKMASNDKERTHLYELLSQRITQRVKPHYESQDMIRGHAEEAEARYLYDTHYAKVETCGFITNDRWGFTLGASPDGLVGANGMIEAKSRDAKYQVETLCARAVPSEHVIQCQALLLISEREWLDFLSYSNGMPMYALQVEPDPVVQEAIIEAATAFEARLNAKFEEYIACLNSGARLIPTEYSPPPGEMYL